MAHQSINQHLRARSGGADSAPTTAGPFPFPATVAYLTSGIKKLREAEGTSASRQYDLFRGMANVQLLEQTPFMARVDESDATAGCKGGTERALMSTSTSLRVAIEYSASKAPLIFKIKTSNFRQRGGNIAFLSCFPEEEEFL